jgi:hypothetical protein
MPVPIWTRYFSLTCQNNAKIRTKLSQWVATHETIFDLITKLKYLAGFKYYNYQSSTQKMTLINVMIPLWKRGDRKFRSGLEVSEHTNESWQIFKF